MGKQLGIIQFRGKLGQTVGSKKTATQKVNGIRAYQQVVKNPQTQAQATQRMKMTPAVNFYRALVGILDHSFQGKIYGAPCQSEFMRQALLMDSGFPYLVKGDTTPWPGSYLLSQGSLAPVAITELQFSNTTSEGVIAATSSLFFNEEVEGFYGKMNLDMTIGRFSQILIDSNRSLKNGYQLTFVICKLENNYPIYITARFVLDTASTATMGSWYNSQKVTLFLDRATINGENRYRLSFSGHYGNEGSTGNVDQWGDPHMLAAAVIVSAPPRSKGGAWLRSECRMSVTPEVADRFMSSAAFMTSFMSFRPKVADSQSSYYLNQGDSGAIPTPAMLVSGTLQNGNTLVANALYYKDAAGNLYLVIDDPTTDPHHYYVYVSGNTYLASDNYSISSANLTANQVETITMATVQNYLPSIREVSDNQPQEQGQGSSVVEDQP